MVPGSSRICGRANSGGIRTGSALTMAPVANMINPRGSFSGYQHTFIVWGIMQGVVVLLASLFSDGAPQGWTPKTGEREAQIKAKINTSAVDISR